MAPVPAAAPGVLEGEPVVDQVPVSAGAASAAAEIPVASAEAPAVSRSLAEGVSEPSVTAGVVAAPAPPQMAGAPSSPRSGSSAPPSVERSS